MKQMILLLLSLVMVSCYSLQTMRWGEWSDSDVAGVETDLIASFDWSEWPGMIASIDGNKSAGTGYKKAKLLPGRHVFEYSYYLVEFGPGNHVTGTIEIELKAGHSYIFCFDYCYWCKPRRSAVWIDDLTTGEVVWGKRRDWPFWFL